MIFKIKKNNKQNLICSIKRKTKLKILKQKNQKKKIKKKRKKIFSRKTAGNIKNALYRPAL